MSSNLYQTFQSMIPKTPLMLVKLIAHNADGTSQVETYAGEQFKVFGQQIEPPVSGDKNVFIRNGEIVGEAPSITVQATIDI